MGPSTFELVKVHPFELSYYNELIGGPRGAWQRGLFELTYWYDAFNSRTLADLNRKFPRGAEVDFFNDKTNPMTFLELQSLGELRSDVVVGWSDADRFPYIWLLTQDSKASAFTRLLFAMKPWYDLRPPQLDGLRVATVADPEAVSRAYALRLLLEAGADRALDPPAAPEWVDRYLPFLARFWGVGLTRIARLGVNKSVLDWARRDPAGLLAAAEHLAANREPGDDPGARLLMHELRRIEAYPFYARELLHARPEALVEAVKIVIARPEALEKVLTRYPYTDPDRIGGPLDKDVIGTGSDAAR
jgi:hypothetical protein